MISSRYFAPVVGLAVGLAVAGAGGRGFILEKRHIEEDQRNRTISLVGQHRAALEGALNETLYLTNGLVAYVQSQQHPAPSTIRSMLEALYREGQDIRNIGVAPGNRITYLYPLEGNEVALGLYYPDMPEQWPAVKRAIEHGQPSLAGPLQLKQGGEGLIYRVPVFRGPDRKYWGIISMVMDQDKLLRDAGIAPRVDGLKFALRGVDGRGESGAVFLGDAALFSADSVKATIRTPGGNWQLAAMPVEGWSHGARLDWLFAASMLLAAVLGYLVYFALASAARHMQSERLARQNRDDLNEAQRIAMMGSWVLDLRSGALQWSDEIFRIFELDPATFEASYDGFLNAIHPEDRELVNRTYTESLATRQPYDITHRLLLPSGHVKYVRERCETLYDEDGKATVSHGTVQDITQLQRAENALRESEEMLRVLANTDSLTGMANRRHFLEQVEMELARAERFHSPGALIMLDLDYFKRVNDTYGHAVGDAVLRHFADTTRHRLRRIDLLGRLGGEEFGIFLPGTDAPGAMQFAEGLRAHIEATPAPSDKGPIKFTVSMGVVEFDPRDPTLESLMVRADIALYRAKEGGRNQAQPG